MYEITFYITKGEMRLNRIYELFVLGELIDRTMHGYLLYSILNKAVGPLRKISWGVLYPLIHGLENEALIEQVAEDDSEKEKGKKKKNYRITEEGKRRFYRLMEEPIDYKPEYELHFQIKMSNFDQIEQDLQLTILYQYKDYLKFLTRHIEGNVHDILKADIPEGERKNLVRLNKHRLMKIEMDETWVDQNIERIKKENGGSSHE